MTSRQKEVADIIVTLFDQEKVWAIHEYNVAMEAEEKGRVEGKAEGLLAAIRNLMDSMGWDAEKTMDSLKTAWTGQWSRPWRHFGW